MRVTGVEGNLIVGCLTGAFTLAGAYTTQRLQRTAAQAERIWNRQADTYVSLLQYHGSGMLAGPMRTATTPEWAVRDNLTATAKTFASSRVLELWQKAAQADEVVNEYVNENWPGLTTPSSGPDEIEDAKQQDPELRNLLRAWDQASKDLEKQIRAELGAHS
jgi:hypothetical protein